MKSLLYSLRNWLLYSTHRPVGHQFEWALKCRFAIGDEVTNTKNLVTELFLATLGLSSLTGDPITRFVYLTQVQKSAIKVATAHGYKVFLSGRWDADC